MRNPVRHICLSAAIGGMLVAGPTQAKVAGDTSPPARATEAPSLATQIPLLMTEHPEGGAEFDIALRAATAAEPDGAAAVASLLSALGNTPMPTLLHAIMEALPYASPHTAESLKAAIAYAIANSDNPVATARGIIAASATLPPTILGTVGQALAAATTQLVSAGNSTSAMLISFEAASAPASLATSFSTAKASQVLANAPNADVNSQPQAKPLPPKKIGNNNVGTVPETHVSPN